MTGRKPARSINPPTMVASRPTGTRIRTTPLGVSAPLIGRLRHQRFFLPGVDRHAAEAAAEALKRRTDRDASVAEPELTDGVFVIAASLFDRGQRTPHAAI